MKLCWVCDTEPAGAVMIPPASNALYIMRASSGATYSAVHNNQ